MINKIVDLSAQLRQKDVPVSIRSTKAAIQVYEDLGEEDRNLLKTALMAVYVKDKYDIPKFNKVFEEIFAIKKVEMPEEVKRSKAYEGRGPKSNKYIIKKQESMAQSIRKEKITN